MKMVEVFDEKKFKVGDIEKIKVIECRTTSEVTYRIDKDVYFQPIKTSFPAEKEKCSKEEETSKKVTHSKKCCIIL